MDGVLVFFSNRKKIAISFNWGLLQKRTRMLIWNRFPWKSDLCLNTEFLPPGVLDLQFSQAKYLITLHLSDLVALQKNSNSCCWHKVDVVLSCTNNEVLMNALYKKASLSGSNPISWIIDVLKTICRSLYSFGDCNSILDKTLLVLTAFLLLLSSGNSEKKKKAFPTRHALIALGLDKIPEFSSLLEVYVSVLFFKEKKGIN